MRKINNNYLGTFYIEELENREEQDRVKLYDSNENYLDYLPLERYDDTDPTFEEQYDGYIKMLESFETVPDLMDWLVCDCDFIGSKDEMREIEEQVMPTDAIMEFLGFENPHYLVEPGAWYLERNFVAYNSITGLLVIEVRKSLNI